MPGARPASPADPSCRPRSHRSTSSSCRRPRGWNISSANWKAASPESEVLFTSAETCRKQYPLPCIASAEELAAGRSPAAARRASPRSSTRLSEHQAGQRLTAEIRLDPAGDPFLRRALAGRQAAACRSSWASRAWPRPRGLLCDQHVVPIEDVQVHNGVSFPDSRAAEASRPGRSGCRTASVAAQLTREFRDREGRLVDPARLCVACRGRMRPAGSTLDRPSRRANRRWAGSRWPIRTTRRSITVRSFAASNKWRFSMTARSARSWLRRQPSCWRRARPVGWIVPAAALDACLMLCSTFAYFQFGKRFEIPVGDWHGCNSGAGPRAGEICLVRMYYKGQDARSARYDFRTVRRQRRLPVVGHRLSDDRHFRPRQVIRRAP